MDIFWQILQDNKSDDKIRRIAGACLCKIIGKNDMHRENYIKLAGLKIKQDSNISYNIEFLLKTDFASFLAIGKGAQKDFTKLEAFVQENNIVNATVTDFIAYHQKVKEKIKDKPELIKTLATMPLNLNEMFFSAKTRLYLEFLKYLCLADQSKFLTDALLDAIWKVYYVDSLGDEHSAIFFEILMAESSSGISQTIGLFDNQKTVKNFIENYLGNDKKLNLMDLQIIGYKCFEKYFIFANETFFKASFRVGILIGIEMLWKMILEIKRKDIQQLAVNLLVDTYKKCISNETENKKEIVEDFIKVCFNKAGEDDQKLIISLNLLKFFITK